jgi:opacity protein-like surface antigen
MVRLQALAVAAGVVFAGGGLAEAVDLPPAPTLPAQSASEDEFMGWYLRGDIGLGVAVAEPSLVSAPGPVATGVLGGVLSPAAFWASNNTTPPPFGMIDAGVGYRFNAWFRMDGTLEYRGGGVRSHSSLTDPASPAFGGPVDCAYFDRADVSSIVGLLNGYADLGTYWGFTPFVGAGFGFADNRASGFADRGLADTLKGPLGVSAGSFSSGSRTSFAWALMAGLDYDLAPNLKLELGYRYLNYGSLAAAGFRCVAGAAGAFGPADCDGVLLAVSSRGMLASSDFRLGLIWTLGELVAPPAPVVARY